MNYDLIRNDTEFTAEAHQGSKIVSFDELLRMKILTSPGSQTPLTYNVYNNKKVLSDGEISFPFIGQSPLLYPSELSNIVLENDKLLDLHKSLTSLEQYFLLSKIKQSGDINSPPSSKAARKVDYRFFELCKQIKGLVLDVGCDQPEYSKKFFSPDCQYIGIDPFASDQSFRIIGMGEMLPFKSSCLNAVSFNTSLDHILDYQTAINESHRCLKNEGHLLISSYAWLYNSTLLTDSVHFHHFREDEILHSLDSKFDIISLVRYECPKYDPHRYMILVDAVKI